MMKPVWKEPRLKYNSQDRVASSQGTQSLSLRGEAEAISDDVTPHPPLSGGLLTALPLLRGTKGGSVQLASLTTENLGFSFPPLTKGEQREFDFIPSPLLGEGQGEGYSPIRVASIGSLNGILSSALVQTIPPPSLSLIPDIAMYRVDMGSFVE